MKLNLQLKTLLCLILLTSCSREDINDTTNNNSNAVWEKVDLKTSENLNNIEFVSDDIGFVTADAGKLFKTTDGGENWTEITTGVSHKLNSLSFNGTGKGMINGLKTVDNGTTWSLQESTKDYYSYYVSSDVLVGGSNLSFNGKVYKSNNNGATWVETHNIAPKTGFYTSGVFSGDIGFLTSWYSGRLLKTTNGGSTWTTLIEGDSKPEGQTRNYDDFSSVHITKNKTVLVTSSKYIIKSTNQKDFTLVYTSETEETFTAFDSYNSEAFLAVGSNGSVYTSNDVNKKWNIKKVSEFRLSGAFITKNYLFAIGRKGELHRKKR